MSGIEIKKAEKANNLNRVTTFAYESDGHYRISILRKDDGWDVSMRKEAFPETFVKRVEDVKLIADYKGDSELYLAFVDGEEAGQLQITLESFSNSLRVWDIDVWQGFKRRGVGTALMEKCKERARALSARRIVLETQSSNLPAIEFYGKMGFDLIGLDASHYTNDDIEKGEVRLEMALHL